MYHTLVSPEGLVIDTTVKTYDQAFVLLALAEFYKMCPEREDLKLHARSLMRKLCEDRRCPAGGFWEAGAKGFLSNPQMHLLEAALSWVRLDTEPRWEVVANEIVDLAIDRFIQPSCGALFEEFDSNWRSRNDTSSVVEPGHQFEWAWLLKNWALLTDRQDCHEAAGLLYNAGLRGIDMGRNVAVDEVDSEFRQRRSTARLWPQTERLKAASIFFQNSDGKTLAFYEDEVVSAAESLWTYLDVPVRGLWRDQMLSDGSFVEEPAPASSFYHIILATDALRAAANWARKI
jgi:mannose-6-phosphate isomerase